MAGVYVVVVMVALCLGVPSLAAPLAMNGQRSATTSDVLNLLVTGVLNQESRLQEVERKVASLGTAPGRIQTWRGPTAVSQQTQDLETRVSHLEQDLQGFEGTTNHRLNVVRSELKELQRKESEDIRGLHSELADDVEVLDEKVNSSTNRADHEIDVVGHKVDTVEGEVNTNANKYHELRNNLIHIVHHIRGVEVQLGDKIHQLEGEVANISKTLEEMEKEEGSNEPHPGVGTTGGAQSYPLGIGTQARTEEAWNGRMPAYFQYNDNANRQSAQRRPVSLDELLREDTQAVAEETPNGWMRAYPNTNAHRQSVERKPASLEELLDELDNYNM